MIPERYIQQLAQAQKARSELPLKYKFDNEVINSADEVLRTVCSDKNIQKYFYPFIRLPYFLNALRFTIFWYSDELEFEDISKPLYRAEVSKTVLFRELFLLSILNLNSVEIIDQIVNLNSLKQYASSKGKKIDFEKDHFFLHSSHSMNNLSPGEYANIDKQQCAPILYPMYEAEIIASFVSILISTVLQIFPEIAEKIRKLLKKLGRQKKTLNKNPKKKFTKFLNIMMVLFQEMYLRDKLILKIKEKPNGTIKFGEIEDIYTDYIAEIEENRKNKNYFKTKYPRIYNEIRRNCLKILSTKCKAKTIRGKICTRQIPLYEKYCWQHKEHKKFDLNK